MKTIKTTTILLASLCIMTGLMSCSSSDDSKDEDPSNGSYFSFSMLGAAFQTSGNNSGANFEISDNPDNNEGLTTIYGNIIFKDTFEGNQKLVSLFYDYQSPNGDDIRVELNFPTGEGSKILGEFQVGSTGLISFQPDYFMTMSFGEEIAFYDDNGDGNSDLSTDFLSKNIVVVITEYEEESINGAPVLTHIKGKIGASGNTGFFKAFSYSSTELTELLHNVTAEFEFTLN